jgi:hypothetical protein
MTLRVAEPSPDTIEAVRSQLSELAGRADFRARRLARANPTAIGLAAPHDVYTLGLDEIAAGAPLDAARVVGRRFLVMDGDDAVASAEVAEVDGSGFQSNEGPFVAATAAAIAHAESDRELADGSFELRVLRIPALYLMALWLKDDDGGSDVVIPIAPAPAPLEPLRSYPPEKLMSELAGQARARLEAQDV